tara:strand:- start:250 stop:1026 length:777 start_codon:yes stop_codon:yes gene_type:complete
VDTKQALAELGVDKHTLTTCQRQALDEDGFFIVEGILSEESCSRMRNRFDQIQQVEGKRGGWEVHTELGAPRLSNGLNKTAEFDDCLYIKPLLATAFHLLQPSFKVHGFNIRDASPGFGHQRLHSDYGRAVKMGDYHIVNSLILFDPFTSDNGAARVVPGSHRSGLRPEDVMNNPLEAHQDEVYVIAPAGSIVILNAHTWHGGTLNVSGARRRVAHLSYCLRHEQQQFIQQDFLTSSLYERMPPAQRYLLQITSLNDS